MKKIYRVVLAKYADMYVEADNPEEAMEAADERMGDWVDDYLESADEDGEYIVDSCESYPTPAKWLKECDEWPTIYTSEGPIKLGDYKEGGEE